jgi:thiamine-monophosphate kinase
MSKIRDEDQLIRRIARVVPSQVGRARDQYGLALGIGDDAAILSSRGREWVVSCDAFIEGVHFLPDVHCADSVGYKALVRAASDLIAMGAQPRLFLLTLGLPEARTGRWLDDFLRGMRRAAQYLDMRLAGGDTTTGGSVSISITVMGEMGPGKGRSGGASGRLAAGRQRQLGEQALTRSGGRPGDRIYVTGTLGRAQLGLELIRQGRLKGRRVAFALRQHLYPRLRIKLGLWLARNHIPSAMMDLSDGLSTDLARLCRASGAGAKVWSERIPTVSVPVDLAKLLGRRSVDLLERALHGGDDYELLFTVPPRSQAHLRFAPDSSALTCIGELTRDRRILLVDADGYAKPLKPCGWDPFRKQPR